MKDKSAKFLPIEETLNVPKLKEKLALQIKEAWDLEMKAQQLQNSQLEQQLATIDEYFQNHGHLFMVRADDGSLMKDMTGMPIPIRLPNSEKELNARKQSYIIIQGLNKQVDELEQYLKLKNPSKPGSALDASKFEGLFTRPKEPKDEE